jgi:hypothetical protein
MAEFVATFRTTSDAGQVLVRPKEFGRQAGIGRTKVFALMKDGTLTALHVGKRLTLLDLHENLEALKKWAA